MFADECFPYGTKVKTDHGDILIGDLFEKPIDFKVLSCDTITGKLEYKRVLRKIPRTLNHAVLKVNYEGGYLVCTDSHKIWTEEHGYQRADQIKNGTTLRILREDNGQRVDIPRRFCSRDCANRAKTGSGKPVEKLCELCEKPFSFKSSGEVNNTKRRFCSGHCAAVYRSNLPHLKKLAGKRMSDMWEKYKAEGRLLGAQPAFTSTRMKANNPMKRPEWSGKLANQTRGEHSLARGGNGQLTNPQVMLSVAMKLPMEYPIKTKPVAGKFSSLPSCYKVDLAIPEMKIAIEVDGYTHKTPKWKFLDARKTKILNALGWTVLRFWNEEILSDMDSVIARIRQSMTSK